MTVVRHSGDHLQDPLAQSMVDLSARGMTLAQVASKVGLDVEVVHERMSNFLDNQATSMSLVQRRMLQLRRLERILDALDDQVMGGDLLTQGRNVKNVLDTIREITDLMDLKKDKLRDEQVRLTQAHTALVLKSLGVPQTVLLGELLASWIPQDRKEEFQEFWNTRFPELAAQGVEENTAAMIKMGGNSGPVELMPVPPEEQM